MLDIAWPELVVIGAVALVAIGPKDLPKVMRTMGRWAGKARRFMHEINRNIEQLSYEAEIADKLKRGEAEAPQPPIMTPLTPEPPKPDAPDDRSAKI